MRPCLGRPGWGGVGCAPEVARMGNSSIFYVIGVIVVILVVLRLLGLW